MWLLLAVVSAAPAPVDPVLARLAGPLRAVAAGQVAAYRAATLDPLDPEWISVVVDGDPGLSDRLARAGWTVEAEAGGRVQVRVRYRELYTLAGVDGVRRVREPWRAHAKETTSEGYDATMTQDWHTDGVTGKGATVAIVDVGFRGYEDLLGTELPSSVTTDFSRGDDAATDHGVAVAEVIHDFAPDADLVLASFGTDVEFCSLMEDLVAEAVDVINGSIGFDNVWHADGTSSLSVCADWAVENGSAYFAAAGNENDKYRVGALGYVDQGESVSLAGVEGVEVESLRGYVDVSLRWSEPFVAAAQDLDLVVLNADGSECGRAEDYQRGEEGDYPYERVNASGCSDTVTVHLYSPSRAADLEGLEGYLYSYYGMGEAGWTNTEDLTLPGDLFAGVSVGAYYWTDDSAPDYTSRGPTNDGRLKPDVSAPTAVSTATYGRETFEGSSAATPHAAGLGALWVSATRLHGAPDQLKDWMLGEAVDLGDAGADEVFGAGAVRGAEVPNGALACGCGVEAGRPGAGSAIGALAGALLLARRRR